MARQMIQIPGFDHPLIEDVEGDCIALDWKDGWDPRKAKLEKRRRRRAVALSAVVAAMIGIVAGVHVGVWMVQV